MVSDNRPDPRKSAGPADPPNPVTPPPPAQAPAKPVVHRRLTPPPPIVAYEDVIASCGHPEKFGLFEDRLDKFRKGRRKKVTDRPCKACRERKRLEEQEAIKVRKVEKKQRAEGSQGESIPTVTPDGPLPGAIAKWGEIRGCLRCNPDAVDRHPDHRGKHLHRVSRRRVQIAQSAGPPVSGEPRPNQLILPGMLTSTFCHLPGVGPKTGCPRNWKGGSLPSVEMITTLGHILSSHGCGCP